MYRQKKHYLRDTELVTGCRSLLLDGFKRHWLQNAMNELRAQWIDIYEHAIYISFIETFETPHMNFPCERIRRRKVANCHFCSVQNILTLRFERLSSTSVARAHITHFKSSPEKKSIDVSLADCGPFMFLPKKIILISIDNGKNDAFRQAFQWNRNNFIASNDAIFEKNVVMMRIFASAIFCTTTTEAVYSDKSHRDRKKLIKRLSISFFYHSNNMREMVRNAKI